MERSERFWVERQIVWCGWTFVKGGFPSKGG